MYNIYFLQSELVVRAIDMAKNFYEQLPFMDMLASPNTTKIQREALLGTATAKQIRAIRDLFENIRYQNIRVSQTMKAALKKKSQFIVQLTDTSSTQEKRRKSLVDNSAIIVYTIKKVLPPLKRLEPLKKKIISSLDG